MIFKCLVVHDFTVLINRFMESSNPFAQRINKLNKIQLHEFCEAIDQHMSHYDTLIRRQLDLTDKNYKLIEELSLDLLTIYQKIRNDKTRV